MTSPRHPEEDRLRELLAAAHRVLYHQGLVDYLGHCSVRVPGTDRVLIKPKHSPNVRGLGSLRPEDMVVIDLDGNLVDAGAAGATEGPPAECFIHTEIYRARPDVSAVVHTHQPAGTLLGDAVANMAELEGPFDTILCYDVLEHLVDPAAVLVRAHELLAPGGKLHVSIPNARYFTLTADLVFAAP